MSQPRVLIIGGGISGLSTAWWLSQAGIAVEIWEQSGRAGGKIRTTQQQGYQMEQAAALLLNFRPEVAEFIARSGLEPLKNSRTDFAEQNRYLLNQGQLNPITMSVSNFLLSKNWSMKGRLRMMMEPLIPRGGSDEESVTDFITRRFGRELLDKAMDPFVAGTLASDPDLANASATLSRLTALEEKFGSLTLGALIHKMARKKSACVTETFSFNGGMSTLVDRLSRQPGVTFCNHRTAVEMSPDSSTPFSPRWRVCGEDETRSSKRVEQLFDQVILSTPASTAAALLRPISPDSSQLLNGVEYASMSVLHTGFDRNQIDHPLDGTGFLTPRAEQMPFNGNLWMSSLFRGRAPAGKVLLTTYLGGARHPEMAQWASQRLIDTSLEALQPILGITDRPEMVQLHRHSKALPLYHGHYSARMRQLQQQLADHPGLHIVANYLGGISVRDRIAQGRKQAEIIRQQLAEKNPIPPQNEPSYWSDRLAQSGMIRT